MAEAYIFGLEERTTRGGPLKKVTSVASFFLSRIDVLLDPLLEKIMAEGGSKTETAATLRGQAAIASAKVAYSLYKKIFATERLSNPCP